jgi:hypothetical protein
VKYVSEDGSLKNKSSLYCVFVRGILLLWLARISAHLRMIVTGVRSFAIWNSRSAHKLLGFTSFSAERDAVRNTHQVVQHYYVLLHRVNVWRWTSHCYTTPKKASVQGEAFGCDVT